MKAVLLLVAESECDEKALLGCKRGLAVGVADSRSGRE